MTTLVFDPGAKREPVTKAFRPGLTFDLFPTNRKDRQRLRQQAKTQANGDAEKEAEIYENLLRRHMVRGWSGVVDPMGQALAFSPDLVGPLLDNFSNLELWVTVQCENLAFDEGVRQAEQLKN